MSFFGASCFTCSPRASSASATSASSPTEGAVRSYRCASLLLMRFPRKPNRKLPPLLHRTRFGAVPSAARRWRSSNDSPRHNSNSVLHRCWPRLHELTHSPHRTIAALQSVSPKCVSLTPRPLLRSPPQLTSAIDSCSQRYASSYSISLCDSRKLLQPLLAPFNLHKSRVRRASGFLLTAFSNATPHTSFQSCALIPASCPKKH